MSTPPSDPKADADPKMKPDGGADDKSQQRDHGEAGKKKAMEEAQEDAADERATEGGYQ